MTQRTTLINPGLIWAKEILVNSITHCTPLTHDAGPRRYCRLHLNSGGSLILVDQSNSFEKKLEFRLLQQKYIELGLLVPEIIYSAGNDQFLILSDLGDILLEAVLTENNVFSLYNNAMALLPNIRKLDNCNATLPIFDAAFYAREFALFTTWYLQNYKKISLDKKISAELERCADFLTKEILAQPQVGVHRDFHCRNLLLQPNMQIGIIDFQDSAMGPISYDVISLVYDAYAYWPEHITQALLAQHYSFNKEINTKMSLNTWLYHCRIMSIQRHLKILGTFARKIILDGDLRYKSALDITLRYLHKSLPQHTELITITRWID